VAPGDVPYLVDFSTSIAAGPRPAGLGRLLFSQMRAADLRAASKLRRRLVAGSRREVPPRSPLYRAGAFLKRLSRLLRGRPAGTPGDR